MRNALMMTVCGLACSPAMGAVIVNGDFEAGNTGFTNDYSYRTVSNSPYAGQYGVTTNSFAWTQFWNTIPGDHTTGAGQFLIVDVGDTTSALWRQTVTVTANTNYTFSAWLATWTTYPATTVRVAVDGVTVGTWGAPSGAQWAEYSASFNSGASTSIVMTITPSTYFQPGADIALDDLRIVPAPAGLGAMAVGWILVAKRRRR